MKNLILILTLTLPVAQANEFHFIDGKSVDISQFPGPPGEATDRDQIDLQYVIDLQFIRTQEDCERIEYETKCTAMGFFGPPYGPLNEQEVALVNDLYYKVFKDTDTFVNKLKKRWQRTRPYLRSNAIELCARSHASTSYPSGHAAISRSAALTLSQIFPHHRKALLERAELAALDRVLNGVHHLSDVKAGRRLGTRVFNALIKKKAFNEEIISLRNQQKNLHSPLPEN